MQDEAVNLMLWHTQWGAHFYNSVADADGGSFAAGFC